MPRLSSAFRIGTVLWLGTPPGQCFGQDDASQCGMPLLAVPLFAMLGAVALVLQLLFIAVLKRRRSGLLRVLGGTIALGCMLWAVRVLQFVFLPDLKAWKGTSPGFQALLTVDVLLHLAVFATGLYLLARLRRAAR